MRRITTLMVLALAAGSALAVPFWGAKDSSPAGTAPSALKPGEFVWQPGVAPDGPILEENNNLHLHAGNYAAILSHSGSRSLGTNVAQHYTNIAMNKCKLPREAKQLAWLDLDSLIGERGREVKEFIEDILGEDGRARSVVVAAPADAPPLNRLQGAAYATAVAEHFRDQGLDVLLLMDSLTRFAMAQREIALAIGEPPATKGYPPSCFAKLPQLVERSGNGRAGQGSITAFYTVLSEGDDQQDPIADAARGILDGHIVLSRELAEGGHYPAIDIERSISRVMNNVAAAAHVEAARRFRQLYARHAKARDLIQLGAYAPGHDADLDAAVALHPAMTALLQQDMHQPAPLADSVRRLREVLAS